MLKRAAMTLAQQESIGGHRVTEETGCALGRKGGQNSNWIESGSDDLNAMANGRSQIYGSVRFIEGSLRRIGAGSSGHADCRTQQNENRDPTKVCHSTELRF